MFICMDGIFINTDSISHVYCDDMYCYIEFTNGKHIQGPVEHAADLIQYLKDSSYKCQNADDDWDFK